MRGFPQGRSGSTILTSRRKALSLFVAMMAVTGFGAYMEHQCIEFRLATKPPGALHMRDYSRAKTDISAEMPGPHYELRMTPESKVADPPSRIALSREQAEDLHRQLGELLGRF